MFCKEIDESPEWISQKATSDLGGQMGVWLGASIFSVTENLILLWTVISKKKRRKVTLVEKNLNSQTCNMASLPLCIFYICFRCNFIGCIVPFSLFLTGHVSTTWIKLLGH